MGTGVGVWVHHLYRGEGGWVQVQPCGFRCIHGEEATGVKGHWVLVPRIRSQDREMHLVFYFHRNLKDGYIQVSYKGENTFCLQICLRLLNTVGHPLEVLCLQMQFSFHKT